MGIENNKPEPLSDELKEFIETRSYDNEPTEAEALAATNDEAEADDKDDE